MQPIVKKILPHLLVLLGFIMLSLAYFSPVLQGKKIIQSDIVQYTGMAKQHRDFKAETGKESYWTNSAFGGMPTYQLGARYPHTYIKDLDLFIRFLPRPADYLFLYFIGFYILLLSLKVDFKLAALGALAFGFSTYLIIILGVGHNSKAHAIAYMPLVVSGILLVFRQKYILGFIVTTIGMGLQLVANHLQMTYYLLLLVLVIGLVYLIDAYLKKMLPRFFKSIGVLCVAVILAIGLNAGNILATQEYAKESTRSKSELTINNDGSPKKEITSGLPKNKITEYSYGFLETFNLFIPRLLGGGMSENLGKDSKIYKAYIELGASQFEALELSKSAPMYWGSQPIVEAPAYVGAVVLFLFVFALFLVKGRLKWWLVTASIFALLLSYGKNLGFLTDLFINYFPFYDKFRAVTSIQVVLELCVPILAIFGLVRLFNDYEKTEQKQNALIYSSIITIGFGLLFLALQFTGILDFEGARDNMFKENYGPQFVKAMVLDRQSIFTKDTLRSLFFVLLSAGTIYLFLKQKLSEVKVIIVFAALIIFDLVGVDRRYVNTENFVSAREVDTPFKPNKADSKILNDTSVFRVYDVSSGKGRAISEKINQMTSGARSAPYFHNTISGYHAANLKRFEELSDFYPFSRYPEILNMFNVKYIISENDNNEPYPYYNPDINGNAWFVEKVKVLNSSDDEIRTLGTLNTKKVAITTTKLLESEPVFKVDSLAKIKVVEYKPNYIKYASENTEDGYAVFSEIYYKNGWNAYIDKQLKPHNRVDYLLRGLAVSKGKHVIEFKFEPQVIKTGGTIALASSIIFGLILFGSFFFAFKKAK